MPRFRVVAYVENLFSYVRRRARDETANERRDDVSRGSATITEVDRRGVDGNYFSDDSRSADVQDIDDDIARGDASGGWSVGLLRDTRPRRAVRGDASLTAIRPPRPLVKLRPVARN